MFGFLTRRLVAVGFILVVAGGVRVGSLGAAQGTPGAGDPCAAASPTAGAGMAMASPMAGMAMGSPMAAMAMEFDQLYIDMMIPHHASIVAMAGAALTRLEDERLVRLAETIVRTQAAEIEELRGYRQAFYGNAEPMPMDAAMMGTMAQLMPGMGTMAEMAAEMDPAAQVTALCAAADADVAFVDLTIPHHESAIAASEAALERATHEEIRAFAERVIREQRQEIDVLAGIRRELAESGTPEASGA